MWYVLIPFVFMMSWTRTGAALAVAPELIERAAWAGVESGPSAGPVGGKAGKESAGRQREVLGGDREVGRRSGDDAEGRRDTPSVDVNACSYADLLRLPGIGPKKARAILEERERRPFRNVHDLRRVKGIGPKTVQRLAPYVMVEPVKAGD